MSTDQETTVCSHCRGTGWVVEEEKKGSPAKPCPHCRQTRRAGNLLSKADIPPRFLNKGFEDYRPNPQIPPRAYRLQNRALKTSIEFVEDFAGTGGGLLFVGPCGVGKTHLSVAILKAVIQEKRATGRFVDETELLRRLQYSYNPGSVETEREVLDPLMKAELVVWDDLGASRPTEWVRETMRTVINHRYTHNRATIFTTNWPLAPSASTGSELSSREETLSERIGRRVFSRILEMGRTVQMDGPDYRGKTRPRRTSSTVKAKTPAEPSFPIDRVFCQECNGSEVTQLDTPRQKASERGLLVVTIWRCQDCQNTFTATYDPDSDLLQYPRDPSGL